MLIVQLISATSLLMAAYLADQLARCLDAIH